MFPRSICEWFSPGPFYHPSFSGACLYTGEMGPPSQWGPWTSSSQPEIRIRLKLESICRGFTPRPIESECLGVSLGVDIC